MKTMYQIVQEHVAKTTTLINNPERMMAEAQRAEQRMQLRFKSDPSLHTFIEHNAAALVNILQMLPPPMHPMVTKSLMAQVIAEWEDINREFEAQLKTTPNNMNDEKLLRLNAHIPSDEIEKDILDTQAEIARMEMEAQYLEKTPLSMPDARLNHMKAEARRTGIKEREEFIGKLQRILDLRKP